MCTSITKWMNLECLGKFTLLLAVLALSNLSSADYCPSSVNIQIQECVQPVGDYAKLLNNNQVPRIRNKLWAFKHAYLKGKLSNLICSLILIISIFFRRTMILRVWVYIFFAFLIERDIFSRLYWEKNPGVSEAGGHQERSYNFLNQEKNTTC